LPYNFIRAGGVMTEIEIKDVMGRMFLICVWCAFLLSFVQIPTGSAWKDIFMKLIARFR
jgi:hypothetical protein